MNSFGDSFGKKSFQICQNYEKTIKKNAKTMKKNYKTIVKTKMYNQDYTTDYCLVFGEPTCGASK